MSEQHKPHAGQASLSGGKTLGEETQVIQLIVFTLGDEEFGADIDQVREIIRRTVVTPIPDSPDFIKGVMNVRGEIAVVIDLKSRFFLPSDEKVAERHIVMTQQEQNLFGLMVDEVTEVLRMQREAVKPAPELVSKIDRAYISGVITTNDRLIMLLDLAKVLSEVELEKLSAIGLRHRQMINSAEAGGKAEMADETRSETAVIGAGAVA